MRADPTSGRCGYLGVRTFLHEYERGTEAGTYDHHEQDDGVFLGDRQDKAGTHELDQRLISFEYNNKGENIYISKAGFLDACLCSNGVWRYISIRGL